MLFLDYVVFLNYIPFLTLSLVRMKSSFVWKD